MSCGGEGLMRRLVIRHDNEDEVFLDELVWFQAVQTDRVLQMKSLAFAVSDDDEDYVGHPFNVALSGRGLALPKLVDNCEYEVIQDAWGTPHLVIVKK